MARLPTTVFSDPDVVDALKRRKADVALARARAILAKSNSRSVEKTKTAPEKKKESKPRLTEAEERRLLVLENLNARKPLSGDRLAEFNALKKKANLD